MLKKLVNKYRSVVFSAYRMEERLQELPQGTLTSSVQNNHPYYYWTRSEDGRALRSYVKLADVEEMKIRYQSKMQLLKAREKTMADPRPQDIAPLRHRARSTGTRMQRAIRETKGAFQNGSGGGNHLSFGAEDRQCALSVWD